MSVETAAAVLSDFGESIGIPGLTFDDTGSCCLVFDANMLVNIGYDRRHDPGWSCSRFWESCPGQAARASLLQ